MPNQNSESPAANVVLRALSMPESPAWLMLQGRNAEAARAITSLAPDRSADLAELGREAGD